METKVTSVVIAPNRLGTAQVHPDVLNSEDEEAILEGQTGVATYEIPRRRKTGALNTTTLNQNPATTKWPVPLQVPMKNDPNNGLKG